MKKIITILAVFSFTFGISQETPKKSCCANKDKKECSDKNKKECSDKKECSAKDKKECKTNDKAKKSCCASKKATV